MQAHDDHITGLSGMFRRADPIFVFVGPFHCNDAEEFAELICVG
jgi:hypothetical protein